jgi:hypothetical protein
LKQHKHAQAAQIEERGAVAFTVVVVVAVVAVVCSSDCSFLSLQVLINHAPSSINTACCFESKKKAHAVGHEMTQLAAAEEKQRAEQASVRLQAELAGFDPAGK